MRLVDYLKAHLVTVPVGAIGPLIARGAVAIGGRIGRIADEIGDPDPSSITLAPDALVDALAPEPHALAIAYEDDELVVVDKPGGMHVHPIGPYRSGTLVNALLAHAGATATSPWGRWRPHPVHRLDRATSGLVLVAKRAAVHDSLRRAFDGDQIHRTYRATVHGSVAADTGTIDAPIGRDPANDYRRAIVDGGQRAVTHYRVVERDIDRTVVELDLETGRTHQLRVHLASLGHPIAGDVLYGAPDDPRSSDAIELRAIRLAFTYGDRSFDVSVPR